ncbi:ABC transporter permease [Bacillus solimangrovi]|uniref:ABC transporter permease n=1 Tax=Bacillus solimangrovi TaxID=1305675 RepID=A0A1E5LAF5_9BACI|nr:ABC transporter permease [Bacillus solimangrovi]OEH91073.1 ABC transporter permease [Bacillus solimangrovi]
MKAYWQLTLAQLRIFARNRQVLFWTLFFPVFLMLMLGSFLGSGNGISLSIAIIDEENSKQSSEFISVFEDNEAVQLEQDLTEEEALSLLNTGDLQLVVIVPKGFANSVTQVNADESVLKIPVYYNETNFAVSQIGLTLVDSVVDGISKQMVDYHPVVVTEAKGVEALDLQYIDFLVPGIVAMMIMSNNMNGVAGQISAWRERGILRRMQGTTLKASTFIAGQITARLLLNGLQAMIVLLIGNLVFDVQVSGSWLTLTLFVILGTLAFMAIGFIIAGIAKTPESAAPIAGFLSFPMLFLGGVFFPINNMPDFLQPVVKLLPISHLSTALREVMNVGASLSTMWLEAVILIGWLIGAFIVASFTFKWE